MTVVEERLQALERSSREPEVKPRYDPVNAFPLNHSIDPAG